MQITFFLLKLSLKGAGEGEFLVSCDLAFGE
jgi:hypothetical protein